MVVSRTTRFTEAFLASKAPDPFQGAFGPFPSRPGRGWRLYPTGFLKLLNARLKFLRQFEFAFLDQLDPFKIWEDADEER